MVGGSEAKKCPKTRQKNRGEIGIGWVFADLFADQIRHGFFVKSSVWCF
jgi:hypothetical protein